MKHKAILYMIIVILLSSVIKAEKYFVLDINYIYGSIAFNKISLREIDRLIAQNHDSGFNIRLISFQDKEIYSFYYNFSDNDNYLIYIPYNENAFRIEVTNPQNSKVMDIDVSYFSNLCGNNICDMHESYESCKKDCQSGGKDDFCDSVNDNTCDPDCSSKTDSDCIEIPERLNETSLSTTSKIEEKEEYKESIQEKRTSKNFIIIILAPIAILALLTSLIIKIRQDKTVGTLKQYINENLSRGYTTEQIKQVLYKEGYKEKEIDKAIKSV